ncbi:MAG: hypothetical protein J2P37_35235, partial [Ktedonobacteraceae bacterium]|nr:hypothetical protein [Ktedonobacteraceae bacterium]
MNKAYPHHTLIAEASNPATLPSRLEDLSRHEDEAVRQKVILNPNTPLPCLFSLAKEFPDHLFANPVLPLLYLAVPDLAQQIDDESWLHILRSRRVPTHWLTWLQESQQTDPVSIATTLHIHSPHTPPHNDTSTTNALIKSVCIVAQQERTPVKMLEWLASTFASHHEVKMHIAQNPATPLELLRQFFFTNMKAAVVRNPRIPGELLEQCSSDSDTWDVRAGVAGNPTASREILTRLALDPHGEVLRSVAHNPATPAEVLMSLAQHKKSLIRLYAALNPNIPSSALAQLATDPERSVRENVARNPGTPVEILARLAEESDPIVRIDVAKNPHTPAETLARLLSDSDYHVRKAVVEYADLPSVLLRQLARDPQDPVRLAARGRLAWLERLEKEGITEPELSCYAQSMFQAQTSVERWKGKSTTYNTTVFWIASSLSNPQIPDTLRQELIDPFLSSWKDRWRERAQSHNESWSVILLP